MPETPKLSAARTVSEVLEAVARYEWWERHEKDCPPEKIPTLEALAAWLPESPETAWRTLSERAGPLLLEEGKPASALAIALDFPGLPALLRVGQLAASGEFARYHPDSTATWGEAKWGEFKWGRFGRPPLLDAVEVIGPAIESLHRLWHEAGDNRPKHPLGPLIRAWQERPLPVEAETRPDRIFPALLNTLRKEGEAHQGRLFNLDIVPRRGEQVNLPFSADGDGQSLLVELFERTGGSTVSRGRGGPASVSLRMWTEGVLSVPLVERAGHRPREFEYPGGMRGLARKLWPGVRLQTRHYDYLIRAAETLDGLWLPIRQGPGEAPLEVRLVTLTRRQRPRGRGRYAHPGRMKFVVDLPKGAERGPIISPNLHEWGRSAPAFRSLLSAPFHWWVPGKTRAPKDGRYLQLRDPKRYPKLTDGLKIELAYPVSAKKTRRHLVHRADKVLAKLEAAGEIQIVDGRLLPPKSWFGEENS